MDFLHREIRQDLLDMLADFGYKPTPLSERKRRSKET